MRVIACLLVLLAAPILFAQGGLSVEVEPVVEGQAEPGKEFTFNLHFIVPDGFHAYHKDNPGYSLPVKIEWKSLAGLELVKEDWPEPHKNKDEYGEEWELGPIFDIAYTFKVPADAKGKLTVTGSHDIQFCDAEGCYVSEGDFSATIDVAAAEAMPEAKPDLPEVKAGATFTGPAKPGGDVVLSWTFEFTEGYHLYHKDNPGYSLAPTFDWRELSGLRLKDTKWPEPKKHVIEEDWVEWEHASPLTIEFTFSVPRDARGELPIKASWTAQICDENACFDRKGELTTSLTISGDVEEPGNSDNSRPADLPAPEFMPQVAVTAPDEVTAGDSFDLKLWFRMPNGFWALHKDTPFGSGLKVSFHSLAGVELAGEEAWPDYKVVEVAEAGEEWRYSRTFKVVYPMRALAGAASAEVSGKFEMDFYDDGGRLHHTATFSVSVDVEVPERDVTDSHGFYLNFDYALEKARKENKYLLVDFNGEN